MSSTRKKKALLPIVVIALGALGAGILVRFRPEVERQETAVLPPLVRAVEARRQELTLNVFSHGTVEPRTESTLVAEVPGRIQSVSPNFAEGGFFNHGEVLVQIDRRDYEVAVSQAEARLAQAKVRLIHEQAEAEVARQEWQELGEGEPTPLTLREPQLAEVRAAVDAAEAELEEARLDLARTRIRAPFDGRLRMKQADLGQFVSAGAPLARVYATDAAEIRLPIPKGELGFLDVSLGVDGSSAPGPWVELRGELGGESHTWTGRVVRTGSGFDPKTRMLDLFVQVKDPFRRRTALASPPLPMGLFVDAEILGRTAQGVFVAPRSALRSGDQVLVVDEESRLRFRQVQVLRLHRNEVILSEGLNDGELVCISPLESVVDGMRVRFQIVEEDGEEEAVREERL